MKIIQSGATKFKTECNRCGCEFEYDLTDILSLSVGCPHCGAYCMHDAKNAINNEAGNQKKDGTLVELPCEIGDTVYTIFCGVYSWVVEKIIIYKDKILMHLRHDGTENYDCMIIAKDYGKEWFFTEEEAQSAYEVHLKELKKSKRGNKYADN